MSDKDQPNPPPGGPHFQLQLDEALSQGVYSNFVLINHTENEFVFDFAFIQPANPVARVRSRVISSPRHTKRLLNALQKNLSRYEERFGAIEVSGEDEPLIHCGRGAAGRAFPSLANGA